MAVQWLFLKVFSLTYCFALFSLYTQTKGLYGKNGVVPIHILANALKSKSFFYLPSLCRFFYEDSQLKILVAIGLAAAILAFLGVVPFITLSIAWVVFLSFYLAGYPFLSFQWDALLVETGLLAIFYAIMTPPPFWLTVAFWVLLFRLMASSGLVKWLSGCPEWRLLNALKYHFETQPLPNKGGFYMHHLAPYFLKTMAGAVFFFEIVVPFLFFGTQKWQMIGAILTILFQISLFLTGNFAFFNILTIALAIPLFSENYLKFLPTSIQAFTYFEPLSIFLNIVGAIFIVFNVLIFVEQFLKKGVFGIRRLQSIGLLNTYGLFAVMTPFRDEVVIEGSLDNKHWEEYMFKYKPGRLNQQLKQIAPLQPRLDWQMWFAALSSYENEFWFQNLLVRLLENSSPVLELLDKNPFSKEPPRYIRALRYRYTFCSMEEWRKEGRIWNRQFAGPYSPILQRKEQ